jgi:hypothetical protein
MNLSEKFLIKVGNHWAWAIIVFTILLCTFAVRYALPVRDGDLYWHMLYGKYFLEHMTLIADHTIFSWTPSTNEYIYCTWLADLFFYVSHQYLGLNGLFAIRYLLMAGIIILCFDFAWRRGILFNPIVWLACLITVPMSQVAAFLKPEIFSFLFMTVLVWNWFSIRNSIENHWKRCYLFPVVMIIWVNTHGGFIFGAIFLFLVACGEILNGFFLKEQKLSAVIRKHLWYSCMLSTVALFCTPYGFSYLLNLFPTLVPTADNLDYMNKIAAHSPTYLALDNNHLTDSANIALFVLLAVCVMRFKKVEFSLLVSNLAFAYIYSIYYRTTFFWAPIFLFSVMYLVSFSTERTSNDSIFSIYWKLFTRLAIVAVSVLFSARIIYTSVTSPEGKLWMGFGITELLPVVEAQYIAEHFPDERIGNTYDQGASLLWELWPDNTVMFDSRHFPYRKWSDEFFDFMNGNNVDEFTVKYPATLWCIGFNHGRLIQNMVGTGKWRIAFFDKNAVVLLPAHSVELPNQLPYTDEVFDIRSIVTGIQLIQLCIQARDFEKADIFLDAIKSRFTARHHRSTITKLEHYLEGTRAFYAGRFYEALQELATVPDDQTIFTMRIISLMNLGHKDYLSWRLENALQKFRQALEATQYSNNNLDNDLRTWAIYNIGVILYALQNNNDKFGNFVKEYIAQHDQSSWRYHISIFLMLTENDPRYSHFRKKIVKIYDEGSAEVFPQFVPGVPEKTDYFFH